MEPYDPTLEALVSTTLLALNPDADMTVGYVDQLRELAVTVAHWSGLPIPAPVRREGKPPPPPPPPPDVLSPAQETALRQLVGVLDPKAGDTELTIIEVERRGLVAVEKEIGKWDAAVIQPRSLSGEGSIPLAGGQWLEEA